ncbi:MAG: OOP family OmpA-OmpF porin [Marivirga sp.]
MKYFLYTIIFLLNSLSCFGQDKTKTAVLSGTVNSKYQDVRPVPSDDGKVFYFARRLHPENQKGEKDLQDVWKSTIDSNGNLSTPKNLGEPFNDKKANDIIRASANGDSLVFLNANYKGVSSTLALFYKKQKDAQELVIDGYYNKSDYVDFDVHFKENVILMAVDRKDTKGSQDLYYSIYQPASNTYSTPMSMGSVINSAKADFSPFLTNDGYTLFFVSYGHKGQGGADIFMSHRQSAAWDDWSIPENLGDIINSPYEETYVSIDPSLKYLYYDSYPSGATNRDIWRAQLSPDIINKIKTSATNKKAYVAGVTANTKINKASDFGVIDSTQVIAATTDEPLLEEKKQTQSVFSTSYDVEPDISTVPEVKEDIEIVETPPKPAEELSFLEKISEKLGIAGGPKQTIELLDFGRKGKKINKNIYYKFDSDKIQSKYNGLLRSIVAELEANPGLKLVIEGHTDGTGGEDINQDLSCRRANNTRDALLNLGIVESRLEISCEGKERPLATNDDEFEGRELNRRVEFYLF